MAADTDLSQMQDPLGLLRLGYAQPLLSLAATRWRDGQASATTETIAEETPVALVKSAYRKLEHIDMTDLGHFLDYEIGMLTTVLVGASSTFMFEGFMVTPRGYTNKYTWDGEAKEGQRPGRSLNLEALEQEPS